MVKQIRLYSVVRPYLSAVIVDVFVTDDIGMSWVSEENVNLLFDIVPGREILVTNGNQLDQVKNQSELFI